MMQVGLFNRYLKEGKGVSKDEPEEYRFFLFFKLFFRKFSKLILLNLIYFVTLIPLVLGIYLTFDINPDIIKTPQLILSKPLFIYTGDIIGFGLLLLSIFISAPATAGFVFVIRNFQRQEHAWVFSDFKEQFAKNFKQSVIMGFIDLVVYNLAYIAFVFYAFGGYASSFGKLSSLAPFLSAIITVLILIYTWMHHYIYLLMVTFKLKLKDILKNSAIFALAKSPVNIFLTIIIALIVFVNIMLPILVLIISLSLVGYIIIFSVYPSVDKYMIKPSVEDSSDSEQISE